MSLEATLASDVRPISGCAFAHVRVTVTAVRIRGANGNRTITLPQPRELDLLASGTGVLQALALPPLGPGEPPELRLDVSDASVETATGQISPLRVPGGLRIATNDPIATGTLADLVIAGFDPCTSLRTPGNSGQYLLIGDLAAQLRTLPFATNAEQFINGMIRPLPGGTYAIVQSDNAGTFIIQQFDAYGNALTPAVTITVNTDIGSNPIITPLTNGEFIGAWLGPTVDPQKPLAQRYPLMVQRYDPNGNPLGGPTQAALTTPFTSRIIPPSLPQIAPLASGAAALVWVEAQPDNLVVVLERLDVNGPTVGPLGVSSNGPGGLPNVVGLVNGDTLIVWGTGALFARVFFGRRGDRGPEQAIAPQATSLSGIASLSPLANGGAVVAWEAEVLGTGLTFVERLAADGSPLEPPHLADDSTAPGGAAQQSMPSVGGLADGGYVAAWLFEQHIMARRFTAGGAPAGPVTRIDIDHSPGLTGGPTAVPLAWGGFLIGWAGAVRLFDAQALLA